MRMIQEKIGQEGAVLTGYLHEYMPEVPDRTLRPAIIFCPGGGYEILSDREADPPAFDFFAKGFQTFILHYSLKEKAAGRNPLREASQAVKLVRKRSEEWLVRKNQIVMAGFSAGAHVAGSLGVHFAEVFDCGKMEEGCDRESNRPDALLLCYPVITAGKFAHRGSIERVSGTTQIGEKQNFWSLENYVTKDTPPTFLWHTMSDQTVPVENSILFLQALRKYQIPCECHLFAEGVHGSSTCRKEVRTVNPECAVWVDLAAAWIEKLFGFEE